MTKRKKSAQELTDDSGHLEAGDDMVRRRKNGGEPGSDEVTGERAEAFFVDD